MGLGVRIWDERVQGSKGRRGEERDGKEELPKAGGEGRLGEERKG